MKPSTWTLLAALWLTLVASAFLLAPAPVHRPLTEAGYLWHRSRGPEVTAATEQAAARRLGLVVLAAELDPARGQTSAGQTFTADLSPFKGRSLGLALRVGPVRSAADYAPDAPTTRDLLALVDATLRAAAAAGITVTELQIDHDAAESKLAAYAGWIRSVRASARTVPVTLTALPAWLKRDAAADLFAAADGFVLQVHSLRPPVASNAGPVLFTAAEAQRAVERAARLRLPFRVALPTYGYAYAFRPDGTLAALAADGTRASPPAGATTLRREMASPAELVAFLTWLDAARPTEVTGLLWYRLPVGTESLNWPWPTLDAVRARRLPTPHLEPSLTESSPGLADLSVRNTGDAEYTGPLTLHLSGRTTAFDPLPPFSTTRTPTGLTFTSPAIVIPPSGTLPLGWARGQNLSLSLEQNTATPTP